LNNVSNIRSISEGGQKKAPRLNDISDSRHTGAPELLVVRFPDLNHPGLRPEPPRGLHGVEALNVALVPPLLAPPLPLLDGPLSRGGIREKENTESQRE